MIMARTQAPAPIRLRRLYVALLTVSLLVSIISLAYLLQVKTRMGTVQREFEPLLRTTADLSIRANAIHASFYKTLSQGGGDVQWTQELAALSTSMEAAFPGGGGLSTERARDTGALGRLLAMALEARRLGQWEDLEIYQRQIDSTFASIRSSLEKSRMEIRRRMDNENDALGLMIMMLGGLFVLSLVAATIIAVGLYINWKRFERSVLGI